MVRRSWTDFLGEMLDPEIGLCSLSGQHHRHCALVGTYGSGLPYWCLFSSECASLQDFLHRMDNAATTVVWNYYLKLAVWEAILILKVIRIKAEWASVGHEELRMGRRRVINTAQNPHPQKPYCVASCFALNL